MTRVEKILIRVLDGRSDTNIRFDDLCHLIASLGFELRIKGDHHIFSKTGAEEILNLQPKHGKAKPYQVKQVRNVVIKYKLGL